MRKIINYNGDSLLLNNILYIPDSEKPDIHELPLLVYLHGAG